MNKHPAQAPCGLGALAVSGRVQGPTWVNEGAPGLNEDQCHFPSVAFSNGQWSDKVTDVPDQSAHKVINLQNRQTIQSRQNYNKIRLCEREAQFSTHGKNMLS